MGVGDAASVAVGVFFAAFLVVALVSSLANRSSPERPDPNVLYAVAAALAVFVVLITL